VPVGHPHRHHGAGRRLGQRQPIPHLRPGRRHGCSQLPVGADDRLRPNHRRSRFLRRGPHAYDQPAVATGQTVAGNASLLVASSQAHHRSFDLVAKQQVALDSPAEIEQAKDIPDRDRAGTTLPPATAPTTKSPSKPYPRAGVAQRPATPAHQAMKQSRRPTMHMQPPRAWASTRHTGTATSTLAR
jgi:hypothetical protein